MKNHVWDLNTPVCTRDFFFWMSAAGCNGIPDINQFFKNPNKDMKKTNKRPNQLYCLPPDPLYSKMLEASQ